MGTAALPEILHFSSRILPLWIKVACHQNVGINNTVLFLKLRTFFQAFFNPEFKWFIAKMWSFMKLFQFFLKTSPTLNYCKLVGAKTWVCFQSTLNFCSVSLKNSQTLRAVCHQNGRVVLPEILCFFSRILHLWIQIATFCLKNVGSVVAVLFNTFPSAKIIFIHTNFK